jgi:hypothetical protein
LIATIWLRSVSHSEYRLCTPQCTGNNITEAKTTFRTLRCCSKKMYNVRKLQKALHSLNLYGVSQEHTECCALF